MESRDLLTLRCDNATVLLAPAIGGSIAAYGEQRGGQQVDWLRRASPAAIAAGDPLGMASFPLIPFCNRIRHGQFVDGSRRVSLPADPRAAPHALHGLAWRRPWEVEQADAASACLRLVYQGGEWPYPFEARQHIALGPQGLQVRLVVTNTGLDAMPLGLGHHPYFPRAPGVTVHADVQAIWCNDSARLPTRLDRGHAAVAALHGAMGVQQFDLDHNFIGWEGRAVIDWGGGRRLALVADDPLRFVVLYTPPDEDAFCVEPVSNCTDWLNLRHSQQQAHIGGTMLAAGATLSTAFSLLPSPP